MLIKLHLTNFRRHENLAVDFTQGINTIRAGNEGGKSSLTEAVGYAMFGVKALRTSLDDTVTWGHDPKTLSVELTLDNAGDTVTFKRSKAGAEVIRNGEVYITGQTEVSNYAAQMLGADAALASKLMFASQNGLRGALEEGPKALSTLIEDLAGFTIFDDLLEAAQHKLALGSPNLIEERLKGAEATLEAARANLPVKPDADKLDTEIARFQQVVTENQSRLPKLEQVVAEIDKEHCRISGIYLKRVEIERRRDATQERREDVMRQAAKVEQVLGQEPDRSQIDTLRAQIAVADNHANLLAAWRRFKGLPDGTRFDGSYEAFEIAVANTAGTKKAITDEQKQVNDALVALKHKRINHDACDKCGQDIRHLDHVKETNALVDEQLAQLLPRLEQLETSFREVANAEEHHAAVRRFAVKLQSELKAVQGFVEFDESVYPWVAKWIGDEPATVTPVAPRAELAQLEAAIKGWEANKAKLGLLNEQAQSASAERVALSEELDDIENISTARVLELSNDLGVARDQVLVAQGAVVTARDEIAVLRQAFNTAKALWDSAALRIDDAQKTIDGCKGDLDKLAFNNALVRKLRSIRPLVANKVWNTVLSSVSVMFSQIRGTPSLITKEKDGFRCDGQAVESLSGSTLDALGVALRTSLLRTFVPQCNMLVLDEPAQGMDEARTGALLGFLQTVDMGQTLLITHESISESVADNIIKLGA